MEFVSPESLRLDGCRPMEMRQFRAEIGAVAKADRSAVFEMGNTKVIAAVYDPREVQNRSQQISDQALVIFFVQVLQADGGTRSACINVATLALVDAGIPMHDLVTSCSSGYLNSTRLLVTVGFLPKLDKFTLLQMLPLCPVGLTRIWNVQNLLYYTLIDYTDRCTQPEWILSYPLTFFENIMQLAIEGCKAVANYIREIMLENTKHLEYCQGV
ncbi:hypothetical protein ACB092_11G095100 [Castanea dentata]